MNKPDDRRRLRFAIRAAAEALRKDWDPIGHGKIDVLPQDEYDSYAPRVVSLIESGASDEAIADYLAELESDVIGVGAGLDLVQIAAKVRAAVAAASYRAG